MVAVEQRRVMWPAGSGWRKAVGESGSVADRGAQIARDTGPSAALTRDGADTYPAPPAPPCGQTGLTRSCAPGTPIRATVRPGADTHRFENTNWEVLTADMWPRASGVRSQESESRMGCGTGDWPVLTAEMKRYEYEIGPAGQISYAAPSGYHDDCVMALALGVWGCHTYGVEPGRMLRLCEGLRSEIGSRRSVTLA